VLDALHRKWRYAKSEICHPTQLRCLYMKNCQRLDK
jgi:hypothetical protein